MKRVFTILTAAVLLLSLLGCGKPKYITEGKLGDTLKTDVAEVTLLNFGFAEEGVLVDPNAPFSLTRMRRTFFAPLHLTPLRPPEIPSTTILSGMPPS